MENKFWTHNCVQVGMTATLRDESCNYCDITQEDIEMMEINNDELLDPEST